MKINFKEIKFLKKIKSIILLSILLGIIRKNVKLILRNKKSALIILIGPLLITILVAAAFNTSNLYDIKIGTYSSSYSELTDSLLEELGDKQFTVVKLESEDDCINKLKIGEVHICTTFPANLEVGMSDEVKFYVDQSRVNLVWIIIDAISSKVSIKSEELSLNLATVVMDTLKETGERLTERSGTLNNLITGSESSISSVNTLSTTLSSLDLDFKISDTGIKTVGSALDSIISTQGYDANVFGEVYEKITNAINKTRSIEKRFETARTNVTDSVLGLEGVSGALSSTLDHANVLSSTITDIKNKIDNIGVSAETIVSPIKTAIKPIIAKSTHLSFIFPTLVVLVIMFISLLLSSTLVVREKTSPAFFRNFITPVKDWIFLIGDYLSSVAVLLIQLAVIFIVAAFFFKSDLLPALGGTFLVVLILSTIFILLGSCIGYIFKSEETSTMAAVAIGAILLFFSSTVLPIETLPGYVKNIAQLNPFVIGEAVLRKIMLFNSSLSVVSESIGLLLIFVMVFAGLMFVTQKISKKYTL